MKLFFTVVSFLLVFLILIIICYKYKLSETSNIYVVLTVFMRHNLIKQMELVARQSIVNSYNVHIIVFQSGSYNNVSNEIDTWKRKHNYEVIFIHSTIETGFYGRFLGPLVSYTTENSYFIIVDDDVIWGKKYFENMIRVVDSGSLAVRMGRLINTKSKEICAETTSKVKMPVTFDKDIEYDFGGHMWAGKMKWIRDLWKYPPPTIHTSEDFWISAVLKVYYNITTKKPMCPSSRIPIRPDLCACSDETQNAIRHEPLHLGGKIIHENREAAIDLIRNTYKVPLLLESNPNVIEEIKSVYSFNTTFIVKDDYMKDCLLYT